MATKFQRKSKRIDLGLAVSGALTQPGQIRSHREIANFCDCHHNMIYLIEQKALKKIRNHFFFGKGKAIAAELNLFSEH